MPGRYCVARLAPDAALPPDFLADDGFVSVTRTEDELSLVYPEGREINTQKCETGWVGFVVCGVLDFALVGILSRLSTALTDAGVSLFAISTHDTDYLFVKADQETAARIALASVATVLA
jgi:uncharacterized protein